MISKIEESCRDKYWIVRVPVLIFMIYIGFKFIDTPRYITIFEGINLGIHEMGHFLFFWTTHFLYVAGGTILQLFAPILSGFLFWKQDDYFAIAFTGFWLSINLYNVATYLGDARSQLLPLVSIGGQESKHDWAYLLKELNLLSSDKIISSNIRILAFFVMWGSIFFGIWIIFKMITSKK